MPHLCFADTGSCPLLIAPAQYMAGSYIANEVILDTQPQKVCSAVASLRRAAVQFAATLDQVRTITAAQSLCSQSLRDCPLIHSLVICRTYTNRWAAL